MSTDRYETLHPAHRSYRQHFCTFSESEVAEVALDVRDALEGESEVAKYEALTRVAELLGIDYGG